MTTLSAAQIAQVAATAGFTGQGLKWAVAVALAESGGNPGATNTNHDQWRSVDRGLWQINSHYHPEVTAAAAFTPASAAAAAYRISKAGTDWHEWSTYNSGTAGAELGRATLAVQSAGWILTPGVGGLPVPVPIPGSSGLGGNTAGGTDPTGGAGAFLGLPNPFDVVSALSSLAKSVAAIASGYVKAGVWLSNPHNYARIGFVVVGGSAALAGLVLLSRTDVGGPVGAVARAPGAAARGAKKAAGAAAQVAGAVATDGASAAASGAAKAGAAAKGAAKAAA